MTLNAIIEAEKGIDRDLADKLTESVERIR
jgi:hypothetical protein